MVLFICKHVKRTAFILQFFVCVMFFHRSSRLWAALRGFLILRVTSAHSQQQHGAVMHVWKKTRNAAHAKRMVVNHPVCPKVRKRWSNDTCRVRLYLGLFFLNIAAMVASACRIYIIIIKRKYIFICINMCARVLRPSSSLHISYSSCLRSQTTCDKLIIIFQPHTGTRHEPVSSRPAPFPPVGII